MAEAKKTTLGLIPKLIIAIILGILVGKYLPPVITRIAVTFSTIFGSFLSFIIPLMILAFVTKGIAELAEGAGKLLACTAILAYASTLIAGSLSWVMSKTFFLSFVTKDLAEQIKHASDNSLEPVFTVPLNPLLEVTGALVFAFMMGICISWLRSKGKGEYLYNIFDEFNMVIVKVLEVAIIPLLPFFIFGNFANMAYSGSVFIVLSIFWKIFLCIIILHLLYITAMFLVAGTYRGQAPFGWMKTQVTGYMTAIGTQSSAATIPVNVECAKKNGVSRAIREFVVPLCATVHMPGSMITLTACSFTMLVMFDMPHDFLLMFKFIAILGIAMVAAPGAPGGAVMSALPFLPVIGVESSGVMATLLISLYLTQDSFGTAANVSGDNAIALIMDKFYYEKILKKPRPADED